MPIRSLLFCPGNRPDMVAKLGRAGADAVVVDLEDGVPPGEKDSARVTAREASAALASANPGLQVLVRVNAPGSPWMDADVREGLDPAVTGIVLPKLETASQLESAARLLDRAGMARSLIVGGLETAGGVENAPLLSHTRLAAVYFGAEDYIADVGGERTASGHEVAYARARVALAARIVGAAAIDQVVVGVKDGERFVAEAVEARQLGYSGKMCIHPSQVPLAHEVFTPDPAQVERSRRLLAAAAAARRNGAGVVLFEGQMVDEPVIRHAEQVLDRAGVHADEGETS